MTEDAVPRLVDARNVRDVAAVAALHRDLLPGSPVPALGQEFMRRFYYRRLVQDGLIGCHLITSGDDAIGFLAWTTRPELGAAIIRRRPISFALALLRAVISSPARVGVLLKLARFSRLRSPTTDPSAATLRAPSNASATASASSQLTGELLSLGVREAFRTREYLRRTKRRHSLELLHAALSAMHTSGVQRFNAYVEHDNMPMLLLYQGIGCELIRLPGAPTVRAEGNIAVVLQALQCGSATS